MGARLAQIVSEMGLHEIYLFVIVYGMVVPGSKNVDVVYHVDENGDLTISTFKEWRRSLLQHRKAYHVQSVVDYLRHGGVPSDALAGQPRERLGVHADQRLYRHMECQEHRNGVQR